MTFYSRLILAKMQINWSLFRAEFMEAPPYFSSSFEVIMIKLSIPMRYLVFEWRLVVPSEEEHPGMADLPGIHNRAVSKVKEVLLPLHITYMIQGNKLVA